ncbi:hypothetical protein ECIV_ORF36 [European chub iridovirus]|nr:hypothetical protein ECIV_ORF36 [European chub iridovirus]
MEIDLSKASFPWTLLSVMQEPAVMTQGAVVRTVLDQACDAMFFTNHFQTEFMRHSMTPDKYNLCKTMRRNEDDHYLREQLYEAAKTKLIQHEQLLNNITVEISDASQRESLTTAIDHARDHFSKKRGRILMNNREAQLYYSKAVALFARDELALPMYKIPHVTKSMVSRILTNEPIPDKLIAVVPDEVRKCPAEVGRYLFLKNANNRAVVKLKGFKQYLLEGMLSYVARMEGMSYDRVQEALNELRTSRIREGQDISEDLYLLWVQSKLPQDFIANESFSYHLLDPLEYLSKLDQIKNPHLPSTFKESKTSNNVAHATLTMDDDVENPFFFKEHKWTNIMDAALYMVCKRMDRGITFETYAQLKQNTQSIGQLYNIVFKANFKDKFTRNVRTFMSRKYAMNPSLYVLMKTATDAKYKGRLVCKTGDAELDSIITTVANGLAKDKTLYDGLYSACVSEKLNLDDLTDNALTNAWLSEMCTHRSDTADVHHGYSVCPATRPPCENETRLFTTFECSKRMSVGWARVIGTWTRPQLLRVRTTGEFVHYLCRHYITGNIV